MRNPHRLHQIGTVLLWLGVLVWAPYFALRIVGESPSMMAFLPFHLLGVIGGARLRTQANKQLGKPKARRRGYRLVAHVLIVASILVWLPYYALKFAGRPVELQPFLAVHLAGVLAGTSLIGVGSLIRYIRSRRRE